MSEQQPPSDPQQINPQQSSRDYLTFAKSPLLWIPIIIAAFVLFIYL